jgi:hypothetical protein
MSRGSFEAIFGSFAFVFNELWYNPPHNASRTTNSYTTGRRYITAGKTPHPQDEAIKQLIGGVMEKLGKIEDAMGGLSTPATNSETKGADPGLTEIPKWRGVKKDGPAFNFFQTHYGRWLAAFDAEQDSIYQYQIGHHDPKLLNRVRVELRREGQNLRDYVKPISVRTDREIARFTPDELKYAEGLSTAMKRRQARKSS